MELNPAIPCSISLNSVQHRFGKLEVLSGLNAHIAGGEHVVIEGTNGSGKSTLGQILAGHLTCTSGEIKWYQTQTLAAKATSHLDDITLQTMLMGPASSLHPLLTIEELLAFHAAFRSWWPGLDPLDWIVDCGLSNHLQSPYSTLSSGMQQRVKLVLALATESALVVLDEPCVNLDKKGIDWYQSCLQTIANQTTIIVCSNDRKEDHLTPTQVIQLN
tara:strand:+ start:2084 stop:2734 length:651 start_codon:yes stop_codon:yes gene_type:complete